MSHLKKGSIEELEIQFKEPLKDAIYTNKITEASRAARASVKYKTHLYELGDLLQTNESLLKDGYFNVSYPIANCKFAANGD